MSEAEREFYAVGKNGERLTVDECFWSVIDEAQAEWDRQAALTDDEVAPLRQKMGDVGYHAYMRQRLICKLSNILGVARSMPRPAKSNPPAGGEGKPEPVAWGRGYEWTARLVWGSERPDGPNEQSWQPLYAAPLSRSGDSALVEAVRLVTKARELVGPHTVNFAEFDKFIQQHGERK